ncbi:unnamed protein product [Adineta ricciae]|uniref:BHLH domain-containing protein n=1 Tax=Adineta ricciae TaxID=249248 RepID=A0A815QI42_ADIRI|nr:unnamed protein product [Adineta ricciae]
MVMEDVEMTSAIPNNGQNQAEKRAHHNALERKRRDHIKGSFNDLRDVIPFIKGEKASRAHVLKSATEYIHASKAKNQQHQQTIEDIKRQNAILELQVRLLERAKDTSLYAQNHESMMNINFKEDLKTTLTNCEDPFRAIKDIQDENGIALAQIRPALPLLDLLGVKRLDFHLAVLDDMKERLIKRIQELAQHDDKQQLEILLEKSFSVINLAHVTPIVMEIVKHMPKIPDRYVKYIVDHEQIYSRAPIELKRLIWTDNHALFQKELQPIISQYLLNVEEQLLQCDHNYFLQLPKQRRQTSPTIQSLVQMIGTNVKLYDIVRSSLQKLYQRTKIVHYSSLRLLLLMAFHDLENNSVSKSDSIHIFVWTLDAALKERKLDVKKQREIEQFLDAHAKDTNIINKHIPFVLADPNVVSILAKSCILSLHKQVDDEIPLPRSNKELQFLLKLLNMGLCSWDVLDGAMSYHDPIDSKLLTHYLPFLIRLIVENRLNTDTSSSSTLKLVLPQTEFVQYMINNRLACQLFLRFIIEIYHQKQFWLATQLIPYLNELVECGAADKLFLHQLVYFVRQSVEQIHYIGILLDRFFVLQAQGHEFVLYYGLLLLKHVLYKPNGTNLVSKYLSHSLKPSQDHSTFIHDKYQQLLHDYDEYLRQLQSREHSQQQSATDKQSSFSIFH